MSRTTILVSRTQSTELSSRGNIHVSFVIWQVDLPPSLQMKHLHEKKSPWYLLQPGFWYNFIRTFDGDKLDAISSVQEKYFQYFTNNVIYRRWGVGFSTSHRVDRKPDRFQQLNKRRCNHGDRVARLTRSIFASQLLVLVYVPLGGLGPVYITVLCVFPPTV